MPATPSGRWKHSLVLSTPHPWMPIAESAGTAHPDGPAVGGYCTLGGAVRGGGRNRRRFEL
jgi:hypothetical protein